MTVLRILSQLWLFIAARFYWIWTENILKAIANFQATEDDGTWHLRQIYSACSHDKIRINTLYHMAEEQKHAEIFADLHRELSGMPFKPTLYDRRDLLADDEIWKMLSFIHVGEVDATHRFKTLARFTRNKSFQLVLEKVVADECKHPQFIDEELKLLGITRKEHNAEAKSIRWQRTLESGTRMVKIVGDGLMNWLLYIVFWATGPLFTFQAKRRLKHTLTPYISTEIRKF